MIAGGTIVPALLSLTAATLKTTLRCLRTRLMIIPLEWKHVEAVSRCMYTCPCRCRGHGWGVVPWKEAKGTALVVLIVSTNNFWCFIVALRALSVSVSVLLVVPSVCHIMQYYGEVLSKKPVELHRFYKDESTFCHASGTKEEVSDDMRHER